MSHTALQEYGLDLYDDLYKVILFPKESVFGVHLQSFCLSYTHRMMLTMMKTKDGVGHDEKYTKESSDSFSLTKKRICNIKYCAVKTSL